MKRAVLREIQRTLFAHLCCAILQKVDGVIHRIPPSVSWTPMTETVSAALAPEIQPLISGAVASLGSRHYLNVVFIGCGVAMQERLSPSGGRERVTFSREVPPSTYLGGLQRELVISCG